MAHSASIITEFVGTSSSGSSDGDIELTTTKEVPIVRPRNGSNDVNASVSDQRDMPTRPPTRQSITVPDDEPSIRHRRWAQENPVTRPPSPSQFSAGSFQIAFNVTQNMSPSCRMLVYYVRNRENIADSKVIDIEDSFANKVGKPISHVPQWSPTSVYSRMASSLIKLLSAKL